MQNPNPRTAEQLGKMLDDRNQQHGILPLPNLHMKGVRFNVEVHKLEEAERLAKVAKIHERFEGEY